MQSTETRSISQIEADLQRLAKRDGECIRWTGTHNQGGYGRVRVSSKHYRVVHRVAYELERGPIPAGMELDHLCRVRDCFNLAHLEVVSPSENTQRSHRNGVPLRDMNYCIRGHRRTPDNIYTRPNGVPECAECKHRPRTCEGCGKTISNGAMSKHRRLNCHGMGRDQ